MITENEHGERLDVACKSNKDGTITLTATLSTPADVQFAREQAILHMAKQGRLVVIRTPDGLGAIYSP